MSNFRPLADSFWVFSNKNSVLEGMTCALLWRKWIAITAGIAMRARRPNGFAKVKVVVIGYMLFVIGAICGSGEPVLTRKGFQGMRAPILFLLRVFVPSL